MTEHTPLRTLQKYLPSISVPPRNGLTIDDYFLKFGETLCQRVTKCCSCWGSEGTHQRLLEWCLQAAGFYVESEFPIRVYWDGAVVEAPAPPQNKDANDDDETSTTKSTGLLETPSTSKGITYIPSEVTSNFRADIAVFNKADMKCPSALLELKHVAYYKEGTATLQNNVSQIARYMALTHCASGWLINFPTGPSVNLASVSGCTVTPIANIIPIKEGNQEETVSVKPVQIMHVTRPVELTDLAEALPK
eukprot:TRINITY_DN830_c0_g1_i2.p1 TRINITY_DN830_c0_g1~~TRINITY_DN830_c0_g1_i2.p1  ORF type:complete len:249 (+),score=33.31 TRINITY_DN830_c0_g1_i2:190-936(+)